MRVGAVNEHENGVLEVASRTIYPKGAHEKLVAALVHAIYPLIATVAHNVNTDRTDDSWAQMSTFSQSIRGSDLARLRRISFDRLSEAAESFDDLFIAYETLHDSRHTQDGDEHTVAVGVYYFEERETSMIDKW